MIPLNELTILIDKELPKLEKAVKSILGKGLNHPWVESPFFDDIIVSAKLSSDLETIAKGYHENGYLITQLEPDPSRLEKIKAVHQKYSELERHLTNVWTKEEAVKKLSCHEGVLKLLKFLYIRNPVPYQTLNFKVGSQQRAHQDSIHFSSTPSKFMTGVWMAFEEIHKDNGPLFYIPKSHKWQFWDIHDIGAHEDCHTYSERGTPYSSFLEKHIESKKATEVSLSAPADTIFIWSSNLMHGGKKILNEGLTRYSMVSHYFYEGCQYYSPLMSTPFSGDTRLINFKNIITGKQAYNPKSTLPSQGPLYKQWLRAMRNKLFNIRSNPDDPYYS